MNNKTSRELELKREVLKRKFPKFWLAMYHHVNVHNKPMKFGNRYKYLIPLYKEFSRKEVVEKCVQSAFSERFVVSSLYEASIGLRVLYVMPKFDLRNKFVADRLDRLLSSVPYYKHLLKEATGTADSRGLKHFGKGIMNFVGSNVSGEFISYPADSLYIDEVDKCDQVNLEMAPDRLDASEYKFDRRIGNPSVENWGIDKYYKKSSQAKWQIKCPCCGKWQILNFFENVIRRTGPTTFDILGNYEVVCKKCYRALDRYMDGEWVHKFPSIETKGYRVNQLFSANVTTESLIEKWKESAGNNTKIQLFFNSKMGLPFSGSDAKLSFTLLEKALKEDYVLRNIDFTKHRRQVFAGVDVGAYYHIIIRSKLPNGKRKLLYANKLKNTKEVINLLQGINPTRIIIDQDPETREVENMKKTLKKMFSCRYRKDKTLLNIRKTNRKFKAEREVEIDRTLLMDTVRSDFIKEEIINPRDAKEIGNQGQEEYGEYYEQLLSPVRIFDEENSRFVWRETGPDHYFHAEAYCKLAEMLDSGVMEYYTEGAEDSKGLTKEEWLKKTEEQKPLIPEKEEELRLLTAENFLNKLKFYTPKIRQVSGDEKDEGD